MRIFSTRYTHLGQKLSPMRVYGHSSRIRRTFAFGDVQGELKLLDRLLDRIQPDAETRLVFVGDFVTRGPNSRGVIQRVRELPCPKVIVAGNHDVWFDRYAQALAQQMQGLPGAEKRLQAMKVTAERRAIFASLSQEDVSWLGSHPLVAWFTVGEKRFVVVHAGISPTIQLPGPEFSPDALRKPDRENLNRLRFYDAKTLKSIALGREPEFPNRTYWAYTYDGRYGFALFGHHVHFQVARYAHALALDTGAGTPEDKAMLSAVEINADGEFSRVISAKVLGGDMIESQPQPASDQLLKYFFA